MKSFVLTIFISTLMFSCGAKKTHESEAKSEEIELKGIEIDSLKAQLARRKEALEAEKNNHHESKLELGSLFDRYLSKSLFSLIFNDSSQFILNSNSIIKFILFQDLRIDKYNISSALFDSNVIRKEEIDLTKFEVTEKWQLLHYAWSTADRSTQSLSSLITERDKRFVYSLFENNTYYQDSGLDAMVKALIIVHEEFAQNKEGLQEIHDILYGDDDDHSKVFEIIHNELVTPQVGSILKDENFSNYDEYSEYENRINYVYRFWGRRYHEGNMGFVYKLLRELDENVSVYPITEGA